MANDIESRAEKVYEYLVDETENPMTNHDREKSRLRSKLLDLMEHIINGDENPLAGWFENF